MKISSIKSRNLFQKNALLFAAVSLQPHGTLVEDEIQEGTYHADK